MVRSTEQLAFVSPRLILFRSKFGSGWSFVPAATPYLSALSVNAKSMQSRQLCIRTRQRNLGNGPAVSARSGHRIPFPEVRAGVAEGPLERSMERKQFIDRATRLLHCRGSTGSGSGPSLAWAAVSFLIETACGPVQLAGIDAHTFQSGRSAAWKRKRAFLDNYHQLPACTPNCFGTALGTPITWSRILAIMFPNSLAMECFPSVQHESFQKLPILYLAYVATEPAFGRPSPTVNTAVASRRIVLAYRFRTRTPFFGFSFFPLSVRSVPVCGLTTSHAVRPHMPQLGLPSSLQALYNMPRPQQHYVQVRRYPYAKLLA